MSLSLEDYGSLAPVLRALRVLGLVPYESLARLRVSRPALLFSCAMHFVCGVMITLVLWKREDSKSIFGALGIVSTVLQVSVPVIMLFRVQSNLDNIKFVLNRAKQICRTIKYSPTNAAPRKIYSVFISSAYIISAVLLLILNYIKVKGKEDSTLQQVLLMFWVTWSTVSDLMCMLLSLQFIHLAAYINGTLGAVNRGLEDLYKDIKDTDRESESNVDMPHCRIYERSKEVATFNCESESLRLRELAKGYLQSCQLVRRLSGGAGALLLQLLSFSIFHLLWKLYTAAHFTLDASWSVLPAFDIIHISLTGLARFVMNLSRIILLVSECHEWTEQMENSRFLMSDIMCEAPADNAAFDAELHSFYIQLMVNQPSYSALGLFPVGRPLLLTMAAISTTYLAILLEF